MNDPALMDVGVHPQVSQLELLVEESKERVAGMDAPVQPAGWSVLRGDSFVGGERFRRHHVTFENGSG